MPGLRLDAAFAGWLIALLAALAIAAAVVFYRTTSPPVGNGRRRLLLALRALTLTLLVFLIAAPIVHLRFTSTTPPVLAVLVDNSRSMRIVDQAGSRSQTLHTILAGPALQRLGKSADVRLFTFGATLRPLTLRPGDTLPLSEGVTDLAGALASLRSAGEETPIDAALLLTDGAFNAGREPVYDAERLPFPVHTAGIGDSTEQRDVLISRVAANELVYAGTRAPVSVRIHSAGFDGQTVDVRLLEGGRVLDRVPLTLPQGSLDHVLDLSYVPEGEGVKRFTVEVSALPGELTPGNNRRTFTARILRTKLRLLLLAGEPSPDVAALRQSLTEEANFSVTSFTGNGRGGFYEGDITGPMLDSTDCLVLAGFPVATSSPATVDHILRRVLDRHLPFLFVDGRSTEVSRFPALRGVLPFSIVSQAGTEQLVFALPREDQRQHPVITADDQRSSWSSLPPLYRRIGLYSVKPGSVLLASARYPGAPDADPMLVARSVEGAKSLALIGYGVWRWRLLAQGSVETSLFLGGFLSHAILWLTTPDDHRPVRVTPTLQEFGRGQPVGFTGQVYNASAQPVDNALLRVAATAAGVTTEIVLRPLGDGRYEGEFSGLPEGEYSFEATAAMDGTTLGSDRGRFSVGGLDLELLDTRMNSQVLRQIAGRTGGRVLHQADLSALDSIVSASPSFVPRTVGHSLDEDLRQWRWLLVLLVLLLSAEWMLRKTSGMM